MIESSLPLVILTGLSGAGLSTALKVLEDLGYRAFDNFPLQMIDQLLAQPGVAAHPVAIAVDARADDFQANTVLQIMAKLRVRSDRAVQVIFLTSDDATLTRRFTETRRRHPLAVDRPIEDGIRKEQHLTYSIRLEADVVIDTSELSGHDLKRILTGHCGENHESRPLTITVQSFSYKRGLPREADLVFDVRFLNNPYWDEACRPLNGQDRAVQEYIDRDPALVPFMGALEHLLLPLIPRYRAEGKSYLTIAVGCTGGQHRSVYIVEKLAKTLKNNGFPPFIFHREQGRKL